MSMNTALTPLDHSVDAAVSGAKASNLAKVRAAGFRVPDGFVITERVGNADLKHVLDTLGGPVAVRSSCLAEDQPDASFAGQYETILNVEGLDALRTAIDACFASATSDRVQAYRAGDHTMAVLIQQMVPADAAGVAFAANPVSGARDEVLVSAVRGLGDRLVGGEVTPDEWVVRAGVVSGGGDAIGEDVVLDIAAAAGELSQVFGSPQDIEWAVAGGELFILQSRPITTLDALVPMTDPIPDGFWERDATHYPRPLTPMARALFHPSQNAALRESFAELGILAEGVELRSIRGCTYLRVVPPGGKDRPVPPKPIFWLLARLHPAIRGRAGAAERALRDDVAGRLISAWATEGGPFFEREIEQLRSVDLASLSDEELGAHFVAVRRLLDTGFRWHFRLTPPVYFARYDLVATCRDLLGWDEATAIELLAGLSTHSTLPARDLAVLAEIAHRHPEALALIERADSAAVRELGSVPEFAAAFDDYVGRHLSVVQRQEVVAPTLAETPELALATLRDQMRSGFDADAQRSARAARREQLSASAREHLSDAQFATFSQALERAQAAHPVQEENEFYTISTPMALARRALQQIGATMVERGVIADADDVFLLEPDEITFAESDLRSLVTRRRGERTWAFANPGPATYGTDLGKPPFEMLPTAARETMAKLMWLLDTSFGPAPRPTDGVRGLAASPGTYTGPVRVVRNESEFDKIQAGDVLVCPITSPVWSVLFSRIGALVTDTGGVLSHPAIIAREFGIPAIVATGDATVKLRDGQVVTVDAATGTVS